MTQTIVAEKESESNVIDQDQAWAAVNTPLEVAALVEFCSDVECLIRINPMLEFKYLKRSGENKFDIKGRNISQDPAFEFEYSITVEPLQDGCRIVYSSGIKVSTLIKIESSSGAEGKIKSKITITDQYTSMTDEQREQSMGEVDKSLITWLNDIQRYLITWKKWSKFRFFRWYMRLVWQPMKPSGRRITYMLLWISLVEVILIGLGVAIYFIEYA